MTKKEKCRAVYNEYDARFVQIIKGNVPLSVTYMFYTDEICEDIEELIKLRGIRVTVELNYWGWYIVRVTCPFIWFKSVGGEWRWR